MEPLQPNDPLWNLLGRAKPVKPRPNFTQNVLRAARQAPQEHGLLARFREWFADRPGSFARIALTSGAALLIGVFALTQNAPVAQPSLVTASVPAPQETPLVAEVETQIDNLEQIHALLAAEDTSGLSDREIAFLLY